MRRMRYVLILFAWLLICPGAYGNRQGVTSGKGRELRIYSLPPFERAIRCIMHYDYDK